MDETNENERPGSVALPLIAAVLLVATVTVLGPILKPLLTALFVFLLLKPAADWLIRRRVPRLLAWLALSLALAGGVIGLGRYVAAEALTFKDRLPQLLDDARQLLRRLPGGGQLNDHLVDVSARDLLDYLFIPALVGVQFAALTAFYLLFIVLAAPKLPGRVVRAFPEARAGRLLDVGGQIAGGLQRYMKGKFTVNLGMAASAAVLMASFGLDYWPLWAFLFFVLNYITYVGSYAACVPPILLGFVTMPGPLAAVVLGGLLIANRIVWIEIIEVKLLGQLLDLDPVLILLVLAYWGWVWGVVGLLLAVPVLTSVKLVLANLERTRPWAVMMSGT